MINVKLIKLGKAKKSTYLIRVYYLSPITYYLFKRRTVCMFIGGQHEVMPEHETDRAIARN